MFLSCLLKKKKKKSSGGKEIGGNFPHFAYEPIIIQLGSNDLWPQINNEILYVEKIQLAKGENCHLK